MNEDELLEIIKQKEEIIKILKKALEDERYLRIKDKENSVSRKLLNEKLQQYEKDFPEVREILRGNNYE